MNSDSYNKLISVRKSDRSSFRAMRNASHDVRIRNPYEGFEVQIKSISNTIVIHHGAEEQNVNGSFAIDILSSIK